MYEYIEVKMADTFFGGLLSMIASVREKKLGIKDARAGWPCASVLRKLSFCL